MKIIISVFTVTVVILLTFFFDPFSYEIKNADPTGEIIICFGDSLMIGFTAEYKSGEIVIDKKEIEEASWFSLNNLPLVSGKYTIARELIDWFVKRSDS